MTQSLAAALVGHPDPMTLQLRPDNEPMNVLRGDPRATVEVLYRDDVVECGVWEVTPGEFTGENVGIGEHISILAGDATVTADDGSSVELRPGVTFVVKDGWRGRWDVRETVRKVYVIWKTT